MSRSALWRQEVNIKERTRVANETFQIAVEEGRKCYVKGQISLYGPDDTFNLNPMLLRNIAKSPYFIKCCQNLQEWGALVDEIYYEVKHMEPWADGGSKTPSTAFCLLLRLFTLRCTEKQMNLMLNHVDSPFIRCIGFLYLRYAADPCELYSWYEPHLHDDEPVRIYSNPSRPEITIGEYAKGLLTEMNYYRTVLPRLPVAIEREVRVKLLQKEQLEDRALSHLRDQQFMEYCQKVGCKIRALYEDADNPTTWYDCVVDRVIRRDDATGIDLVRPKFVVTFPEYGNTETVTLGEIDLRTDDPAARKGRNDDDRKGKRDWNYNKNEEWSKNDRGRNYHCHWRQEDQVHDSSRNNRYNNSRGYHTKSDSSRGNRDSKRDSTDRSYTDSRHHDRSRSRSREGEIYDNRARSPPSHMEKSTRDEEALMAKVRRQEREKSTATGRNYNRQSSDRSASGSGNNNNWREQERKRSSKRNPHKTNEDKYRDSHGNDEESVKMKNSEELAAIEEKKRRLVSRYG